jgi:hypothetical protein
MGSATTVILKVTTLDSNRIAVDVSDGKKYFSDLSSFKNVYCFPKNKSDWDQVGIDNYGLGLIWSCRFEAHIDQILALAYDIQNISVTA